MNEYGDTRPVVHAVRCTYPQCQATNGCVGACSKEQLKNYNERIKELAQQAGYQEDFAGIGHWDMPECKKFAELIVQECADVASGLSASTVALRIKEHFGVKE